MALITGTNSNEVLVGTNNNDTINGLGGDDTLFGLGGNDVLNGGLGADAMGGGGGNDVYIVDNIGDVVAEGADEGTDRVVASIDFSLSASGRFDVENLTLFGAAVNGIGNALDNIIRGNAADNTLSGLAGDDTLFGLGGDDDLFGGSGNDILNGGTGNDNMDGDGGNDTYFVDSTNDVVVEAASEGIDRIISSFSFNLGTLVNVENLVLTGSANLRGDGNALNNQIVGNSGHNRLFGLGGNDNLIGGAGNDSLFGGDGNDILLGQAGNDRLFGQNGNDVLLGGSENDFLNGGAGNDRLNGQLGADGIVTGTGSDRIDFNTALGGGNVDQVFDFSVAFDTMRLENAIFTGLAGGPLAATAFVIGAAAADADDRIVYNDTTGALSFDVDGVGGVAQVAFATLATGLALTSADFIVV
jgi:Ca2+-binding RTX toxin-like protein